MTISDIVSPLEEFAPLALQEPYDNSGLVVGRRDEAVSSALLCVDATPEVLAEAVALGAGLVIAHHPPIFHPLRSITGHSNTDRVVIEAIRNNIALYACHTNLDRAHHGMSHALALKLGLDNIEILDPMDADNYTGFGANTNPGTRNNHSTGFGAVGNLPKPADAIEFLRTVATALGIGCIRHTSPPKQKVQRIALMTGSGGEATEKAIAAGADVFLSADLRHDRFIAAEGRILLADIGHFESEFCSIDLMYEVISKKIANFALHKSANSRNPVNYLV